MNALLTVQWPFSDAFLERVGWVLVHSLWQFALPGLLAAAFMQLMRQSSAEARSVVLIGLLVLSLGFPIATWMLQTSGPTVAVAPPEARQGSPYSVVPPITSRPVVDQEIARSSLQNTEEASCYLLKPRRLRRHDSCSFRMWL